MAAACLRSERSVLLPTSMMTTSFPRSDLTSSIHCSFDASGKRTWGVGLDGEGKSK